MIISLKNRNMFGTRFRWQKKLKMQYSLSRTSVHEKDQAGGKMPDTTQ